MLIVCKRFVLLIDHMIEMVRNNWIGSYISTLKYSSSLVLATGPFSFHVWRIATAVFPLLTRNLACPPPALLSSDASRSSSVRPFGSRSVACRVGGGESAAVHRMGAASAKPLHLHVARGGHSLLLGEWWCVPSAFCQSARYVRAHAMGHTTGAGNGPRGRQRGSCPQLHRDHRVDGRVGSVSGDFAVPEGGADVLHVS
jgi:hypothetical protein